MIEHKCPLGVMPDPKCVEIIPFNTYGIYLYSESYKCDDAAGSRYSEVAMMATVEITIETALHQMELESIIDHLVIANPNDGTSYKYYPIGNNNRYVVDLQLYKLDEFEGHDSGVIVDYIMKQDKEIMDGMKLKTKILFSNVGDCQAEIIDDLMLYGESCCNFFGEDNIMFTTAKNGCSIFFGGTDMQYT